MIQAQTPPHARGGVFVSESCYRHVSPVSRPDNPSPDRGLFTGLVPEGDPAVRTVGYRYQRTLARPVTLRGRGTVTGSLVTLTFRPAPVQAGVRFLRTDLKPTPIIPAAAEQVTGTARRTTLGSPSAQVMLVEHVLASLAGLRIDNCTVELDGPEPPGFDGSALEFVTALQAAGSRLQSGRRPIRTVDEPIEVEAGGATLGLYPGDDHLQVTYRLDYGPSAPIPPQSYTLKVDVETFVRELAPARSFLLDVEAAELQRQGIGQHLTPADLVVFAASGPIGTTLRWANEPARHKALDMIGDLSLCGFDLAGHLVAYRSGHPLNAELAGRLARQIGHEGTGDRGSPPGGRPSPPRRGRRAA